jgi:hypothetical protein
LNADRFDYDCRRHACPYRFKGNNILDSGG